MTIHGSYERHPDLGCEAIVFLDDESGSCFQIQRDLVGGPRADEYCVSTGAVSYPHLTLPTSDLV